MWQVIFLVLRLPTVYNAIGCAHIGIAVGILVLENGCFFAFARLQDPLVLGACLCTLLELFSSHIAHDAVRLYMYISQVLHRAGLARISYAFTKTRYAKALLL